MAAFHHNEVMESEMSDSAMSPSAPPRYPDLHDALRSRSPPRYDAVLAEDSMARDSAAEARSRGNRGLTNSLAHAGVTDRIDLGV